MRGKASSPARSERGSVFMVLIFAVALLSVLGFVLLDLSQTESSYAYRDLWSEGTFWAAEAGIHTGIDQLSINTATSTQPIPDTTIGGGYRYMSGRRSDSAPQPLQFINTRTESGYSIGSGTGYNTSGYVFYAYQVTATGTGPRGVQRELEAQAEFGPVAN